MTETQYTAPELLNKLRPYLDLPRLQYNDDFSQFVRVESAQHVEYRDGLIAIAASVGILFFIWSVVLLILKCGGKMAGCAAGHEFDPIVEHIDNADSLATPRQAREEYSFQSTIQTAEMTGPRFHDEGDDTLFHTPGRNSTYNPRDISGYAHSTKTIKLPSKRERIAQVLFLLSGVLTILSVAPIVLFVFEPFEETGESFESQLLEMQVAEHDISNAIVTLRAALDTATTVVESNQYSELCPMDAQEFNETFKASMSPSEVAFYEAQQQDTVSQVNNLLNILSVDFGQTQKAVSRELSPVEDFLQGFEKALKSGETAHEEYETYIWFIPGLLFGVICVTMIAMAGVLLSCTRKSSLQFQGVLSYSVLPFLVVMSLVAIIISMGAAVSVAVADDACNGGSDDGAPSDTVLAVLETFNVSASNRAHDFVVAYTGACSDEDTDPTTGLQHLEGDVQTAVDEVWKTLANVESIGVSALVETCGTTDDNVERLLGDARSLARALTTMRRAIGGAVSTLRCDQIYPLYIRTVEGSLCTEAAPTIAWAFLLFFAMGVVMMLMITLRASWRHEVEADDLYEENEIDENMFVDEYEEYLAFISKYKHEWEEYEGFEVDHPTNRLMMSPNPMNPLSPVSDHDTASGTDTDSLEMEEKASDLAGEELFEDESFVAAEHEARNLSVGTAEGDKAVERNQPYLHEQDRQMEAPVFDPLHIQSPASAASEDISFFSLSEMSTPTSQAARDAFVLPQPLLGGSTDVIETDDVVMERLKSEIVSSKTSEQDSVHRLATQIDQGNSRELVVLEMLAPPNLKNPDEVNESALVAASMNPLPSKTLICKVDEKGMDLASPLSHPGGHQTSIQDDGEIAPPDVFEDITSPPHSYDNDETNDDGHYSDDRGCALDGNNTANECSTLPPSEAESPCHHLDVVDQREVQPQFPSASDVSSAEEDAKSLSKCGTGLSSDSGEQQESEQATLDDSLDRSPGDSTLGKGEIGMLSPVDSSKSSDNLYSTSLTETLRDELSELSYSEAQKPQDPVESDGSLPKHMKSKVDNVASEELFEC